MRMISKAVSGLIICLFFCLSSVTAGAQDMQRVFDGAALFADQEVQTLEEQIASVRAETNLDFVIVTTEDTGGRSARDYADDFYDEGGFGQGADRSGALLLIDMDNREAYISTTGDAIDLYTDQRIERMLDDVFLYLPDGAYYDAAAAFLTSARNFAAEGPVSGSYRQDTDAEDSLGWEEWPVASRVAIFLVVSLVVAGGFFGGVCLKYSRKGKTQPYPFREQSRVHLIRKEDRFINTTMRTRHIDTHSSGSGGVSSTHTSSSGSTHGGGGRSF